MVLGNLLSMVILFREEVTYLVIVSGAMVYILRDGEDGAEEEGSIIFTDVSGF